MSSLPEPEPGSAVALALDLLTRIAEDATMPSRYRVAARKHLTRLTDARRADAAPPRSSRW